MTVSIKLRPAIGVAVMVWKQDCLLLGQRINSQGENCWQFPGGHLELGETVTECAARELHEETGLVVSRLSHAAYTNEIFSFKQQHYITLFVSAEYSSGEPVVMEPEKCSCWQWHHFKDLPLPLFAPITNLLTQLPDLSVLRDDRGIREDVRR